MINELFNDLKNENFYTNELKEHCENTLYYANELMNELDLKNGNNKKLVQYGAILHDIGKIDEAQKIYWFIKDYHEIIGMCFIVQNKYIFNELQKHNFTVNDIEKLCKIILYHKKGKKNEKLACIVAAADKLAHIKEDNTRKKESHKKIKKIPNKTISQTAIKMLENNFNK